MDKNSLRRLAEKQLKEKGKIVPSEFGNDLKSLAEELSIYQIELEHQNEELIRAQEKLNLLKERYHDLFNNAPVGYFVINERYKVLELNKTGHTILRHNSETISGKDFTDYIDPEFQDTFYLFFNNLIAGKNDEVCDLKLKKGDTCFFARLVGAPGNVGTEGEKNYRLAFIDISKEKELENNLWIQAQKARESERLKSAFMANMSHEIRTPMNGIMGFAELLQTPDLTKENLQHYITVIQNSGKRMLAIINDLVDFSRIESGAVKPVYVKTNINEILDYLFAFFQPQAKQKKLELYADFGTKPLAIDTDKEKLNAVFVNLIKNAIKYTQEGEVRFGVREMNEEIQFFVSDTGPGIPEKDQEDIFDRFYRGVESENKYSEGAGLGLSIAKAYVEMLHGKIGINSEPGKGSTFYFTLPACDLTEKTMAADRIGQEDDPEIILAHFNVLVAEDDEPSRVYLSELLKRRCKNLIFAKNGHEAVKLYAANNIDLVLMDIKMPVMDGYSAAIKIKGMDENAVIIAQTAYALASDREKALAAGCSDYLAKPLMQEDLFKMVRKHFKP